MQIETTLRKFANSSGCFIIPSLFLKEKYREALVEPKLYVGKVYRITIEEVKQ